jgi:hypothetical protein
VVLVDSTMFKEYEHAIELILGSYSLNVRLYCFLYSQKSETE